MKLTRLARQTSTEHQLADTVWHDAERLNRAHRLASDIASAKKENHTSTTVTQLQSYILHNSHIKVFSLDSDYHGDDNVRPR